MMRNLDIAALRSLVAIGDFGGVTRAAQLLNLTQSAVSMQIKRLEEALGQPLLDRVGRGVQFNAAGLHMLSVARRMVALNDEAVARLTDDEHEGEISLHLPYDVVYPHIPKVLRHFSSLWPRMKVQLNAVNTHVALAAFHEGRADMILTTEAHVGPGGEALTRLPLVWIGAPGGQAWRQRPLRLAQGIKCAFRDGIVTALDRDGIEWEVAVDSESDRTLEAAVGSDMAVQAVLEGTHAPSIERIAHGGSLPELPSFLVNLYVRPASAGTPAVQALADLLRKAWSSEGGASEGALEGSAEGKLARIGRAA